MDWLNFLVALNERLKIEIPEADYRKLGTLDLVVDYLAAKAR
jgi:acyl carrier protein